jgi:hypothetical protein
VSSVDGRCLTWELTTAVTHAFIAASHTGHGNVIECTSHHTSMQRKSTLLLNAHAEQQAASLRELFLALRYTVDQGDNTMFERSLVHGASCVRVRVCMCVCAYVYMCVCFCVCACVCLCHVGRNGLGQVFDLILFSNEQIQRIRFHQHSFFCYFGVIT